MNKLAAIGIGVITIYIFLAAFATPIIDQLKGVRANLDSQTFGNVTTGVGVTSASVNLTYNLYQEALSEVQSVSSNETETPAAGSYIDATKTLLITGLDDDLVRTLVVNYYGETEDTGWRIVGPFMVFIIFGGVIGSILWGIFKNR